MKKYLEHRVFQEVGQTTGPAIEVQVSYDLGGMNYFSGRGEARGIYVSISPLKVGDRMIEYTAFSGKKLCVRELQRKSDKVGSDVANKIAPLVHKLVGLFKENKHNEILEILKAI